MGALIQLLYLGTCIGSVFYLMFWHDWRWWTATLFTLLLVVLFVPGIQKVNDIMRRLEEPLV